MATSLCLAFESLGEDGDQSAYVNIQSLIMKLTPQPEIYYTVAERTVNAKQNWRKDTEIKQWVSVCMCEREGVGVLYINENDYNQGY